MKLSLNTDFTKLPKVAKVEPATEASGPAPFDRVTLQHDERHLRRKVLTVSGGGRILIDLPKPMQLSHGDRLVLEDGRIAEVMAAPEELLEVKARDPLHLAQLCWHIGNRHLAAQIETGRLLILRDHVIEEMLRGLGATVSPVTEPFHPMRGAYSGHDHQHGHHGHGESGERDAHGRLPGDPHYGHDHG
jgi:urease accessory protein